MPDRFVTTIVSPGLSLGKGAELRQSLRRLWAKELACTFRSNEHLGSIEVRVSLGEGERAREPAQVRKAIFSEPALAGMDLAFQRESVRMRPKRLLVADMDSTLISIEVIDELARLHGVADRVAPITERAMRGEIGFDQALRERVALLEGLSLGAVEELAANLPLTRGAEELVERLRAQGAQVAVVSGGFEQGAEALRDRLGLDHAFANRLEVLRGKLTGKLVGPIVNGAAKAGHLAALAAELALDREEIVAVGDGANDLEMIQAAGLGVAFRAKPLLREAADAVVDHGGLEAILHFIDP